MDIDTAAELLGHKFDDPIIRGFAVDSLELVEDNQILDKILLFLTQALKYEPYIDNRLFRFLLKKSLNDRNVAQKFFWHLKAEMDESPVIAIRFAAYLEALLRGVGLIFDVINQQNEIFVQLSQISKSLKKLKGSTERKQILESELSNLKYRNGLTFPILSNIKVADIILDKCKYMDSKKLPLWLVFNTSEDIINRSLTIMFKDGDDLRQDMITLQLLKLMDSLWLKNGLDLNLTCYECLATGESQGLIEIVLDSDTVSNIQVKSGGSSAAFRDQPLADWLRQHNPTDDGYEKALSNFLKSCAGYCVATYVLGIGDRHNDNIMLSKLGYLFHIDFGHFLGNIKRKFGIKRERAPFVLTPDFVYVMNQSKTWRFPEFIELCIQAYLVIRRYSKLIINLFSIMLSANIPELQSELDLLYLRDSLCVGKNEKEAENHFRAQIEESIKLGWSTQLNWWIHNIAHSK